MLVRGFWLAALAAVIAPAAQNATQAPPPPLFTKAERQAVVQFWSAPGRYVEKLPTDAEKSGPFQVRLSVAGSIWLREYNRLRGLNKVPPTATAQPQNDEQRDWQGWIDAKIEWDRWQASQIAADSNRRLTGHDTKLDDRTLPKSSPEDPGPAPDGLTAFAGDPPAFAEAVVPMSYEITFEDGFKVSFSDNTRMRKNYAYYRFERGVNSDGEEVGSIPLERLRTLCDKAGVSDEQFRVLKAVSILEGGFDAVNTYDTGYVSVGFIQFATLKDGGNSLGDFLAMYKRDDPGDFQKDFRAYGIDVTPDSKLACVDPSSGAELQGEAAVQEVIRDKRLIAVFKYDGLKSDGYDAMQIKSAVAQFYPADDRITVRVGGETLSGKVSDVVKSEAGLATLMDRKVNTGHLDLLQPVLEEFAAANQVASLADLSKFEYDIVSAMKYRRDFLADTELSQPSTTTRSKPLASRGGFRSGRGAGKQGSGGHSGDPSP